MTGEARVDFRTHPGQYRHWRLACDGPVATLTMDVDEQGGLVPGYELKMNSYDLGVDIELYDAVQRLRFEHPEVRAVVVTSGKEKIFCAGANIRMLAASPHPWKVNFCKFTNETRNGIEDASANSGQTYLRRPERDRLGRGLRAGPGLRAHHAHRRPLVRGVAAGTAAARGAARHRRADPGGGQAARPPRPGGLLLHQVGGPRRQEGRGLAAGGRGRAPGAAGTRPSGSGPGNWPHAPAVPPGRPVSS